LYLIVDDNGARRFSAHCSNVTALATASYTCMTLAFIAAHRAGWTNIKHARQWPATLTTYAYPIFGDLPVQAVDTPLVMRVLEQQVDGAPLWTARPETAARLRGRVEAVLY
jgi:hypothetical protein